MVQNQSPQVRTGVQVDIELLDQDGNVEPLSFVIVREHVADFDQGFLASNTPLAKAILGKFVGSTVDYRVGDVRAVRILSVGPAPEPAPGDAMERRRAVVKKALREAERTNAQMFAASFSSKWGDYDPDGVVHWDESHGDDGQTEA